MLQAALLEVKYIKRIERINIEKQMEINYAYDLYYVSPTVWITTGLITAKKQIDKYINKSLILCL